MLLEPHGNEASRLPWKAVRSLDPIQFVRRAGLPVTVATGREQLLSRRLYLGLRCDLSALPEVPPARQPIEMVAQDAPSFTGFADELRVAEGADYVQALLRTWMCRSDVRTLYVARSDAGEPMYAQWLVRRSDEWRMKSHMPGVHDALAPGEVLLEGAYTFHAFRGIGAMADGMGQLLRIARDEGHRAAITYVGAENVPSLRGCARVGFVLDHARRNERRLGRHKSERSSADADARAAWEAATAPRTVAART
jgi:hypothetical protein